MKKSLILYIIIIVVRYQALVAIIIWRVLLLLSLENRCNINVYFVHQILTVYFFDVCVKFEMGLR